VPPLEPLHIRTDFDAEHLGDLSMTAHAGCIDDAQLVAAAPRLAAAPHPPELTGDLDFMVAVPPAPPAMSALAVTHSAAGANRAAAANPTPPASRVAAGGYSAAGANRAAAANPAPPASRVAAADHSATGANRQAAGVYSAAAANRAVAANHPASPAGRSNPPASAASPAPAAEPRRPTEPSATDAARDPPDAGETQRIVTVRVSALGDGRWLGTELIAAFEHHGMAYGRYQVFHRRQSDGRSLFCAASSAA
jgi:FtsZ-interacting cell division protein ZipA